jgi:hypothetical protein
MFATLVAAAAGSVAGGAVCGVLTLLITGRRVGQLEGWVEALADTRQELVTREEVVNAFGRMAEAEQQRIQEAQMRQAQAAQQAELQRLQFLAAQQAAPAFRAEASAGTFQMEAGVRPPAPSQDELNARLNQQLASLNQRLQQVASQRMPA